MFIQDFIQKRLESTEFSILYDKSVRNTPDLKAKEEHAYFQLINEVEANYQVEVPLDGMVDMVKHALDTSKTTNHTNNMGPSTSTTENSDDIDQVLSALNDCLGELSPDASDKNKNSSPHLQTFSKHRNTMSTPIEKNRNANLPITETFSQRNKKEVKNMEKRLKKMEQKFSETCKLMSEEQSKTESGSYSLLFEYFAKADVNRCDDLDKEILLEIQSWYPQP